MTTRFATRVAVLPGSNPEAYSSSIVLTAHEGSIEIENIDLLSSFADNPLPTAAEPRTPKRSVGVAGATALCSLSHVGLAAEESSLVAVADVSGSVYISKVPSALNAQSPLPSFERLLAVGRSREAGWTGAALASRDRLAVTRLFDRETVVVDLNTGSLLVRFEHERSPVASAWWTDLGESVLATCEWNEVAVWDVRAPRGGLIERLGARNVTGGAGEPLWALSPASSVGFAVGGASRTVSLVDPRKWRVAQTWKAPTKHDVVALSSSRDGRALVALGLDHEMISHTWDSAETRRLSRLQLHQPKAGEEPGEAEAGRLGRNFAAFRARENWIGLDVSADDRAWFARDVSGTTYALSTKAATEAAVPAARGGDE